MSDPSARRDADADPDGAPAEAEASSETDEAPEYENRAARRAKGKGDASQPKSYGTARRLDGRSVQGPRQWGNRRSG